MAVRYAIREGDETTAGGKMVSAAFRASHYGRRLCAEGDAIDCPACGTTGVAALSGSRDGSYFTNGRMFVLEGDLCMCACPVPPLLVTDQQDISTTGSFGDAHRSDAEVRREINAYKLKRGIAADFSFDDVYVLRDEKGIPMPQTYYAVKFPNGDIVFGTTNDKGETNLLTTEHKEEELDFYIAG
jgi:uncharacterized Zn-binding protein involved in type VI secretion